MPFEWDQIGNDIDGESVNDQAGKSVSLSSDGTIVAIGAPYNDNMGQVQVYKWNESNWNKLGGDIDGANNNDRFGSSVSLSSDGTIVAIGAPYNDNMGQVQVYEWNESNWNKLGGDIDGANNNDRFGYSVSLSSDGTIVAIGAPQYNNSTGQVQVYEWNESNWNKLGGDIDGANNNDWFGSSVSLSIDGTIVAIGATYAATGKVGKVGMYKWNEPNWTQLGTDIDGAAENDDFGSSVSLSSDGTTVAIGAPYNNNMGQVQVYKWDEINWNKLGGDIDGSTLYGNLGKSVSLSSAGNIVAIGVPFWPEGEGTATEGRVQVYKLNGTVWNQHGPYINGANNKGQLGKSVSLSSDGTIVAIGAPVDWPATISGKVRVLKYVGDDVIPPTMTITSTTNNSSIQLTFTSSEATTNFAVDDITVSDEGEQALSSFTSISSTVYIAAFTPTVSGTYTITVLDGAFTDENGNNNINTTLSLTVPSAVQSIITTCTVHYVDIPICLTLFSK